MRMKNSIIIEKECSMPTAAVVIKFENDDSRYHL
jgi:hypothetical protein